MGPKVDAACELVMSTGHLAAIGALAEKSSRSSRRKRHADQGRVTVVRDPTRP
jgi:hypothetical protein